VKWGQKELKNLKYLKDGNYFCRKYAMIRSKYLFKSNPNEYYFDSRKIDVNNKKLLEKWMDHIKVILEKVRNLNKKIIIYVESNPIDIYDKKSQLNYKLKDINFQIKQDKIFRKKLNLPMGDQAEVLAIVQGYRSRYMCFYIPLIESILKTIEYIQIHKQEFRDFEKKLHNYILKFAYHCIEFVKSDYIEVEPNTLRWESFFNYFDLPIKVLNYDFKSIKFHGRTFENYQILKICVYVKKENSEIINELKNLGYEEFTELNTVNLIAFGLSIEIYYPCSTIEHIYFLSKYLCFYCLFLLFSHAFEYIKKIKPQIKFRNKEKWIYKNFYPVINLLFDVYGSRMPKKFVFKYYSLNSDELEVLFNHILIRSVRDIEKKMYKYFRFRGSFR
jgi:hypothetical protein